MNKIKVAEALNTISLGIAELAEAVLDGDATTEQVVAYHSKAAAAPVTAPGGTATVTVNNPPLFTQTSEASPFIDIPDEAFAAPQGSLAVCPKHHVPYTDGTYGPYCKEITNDPAWGKQKGDRLWCRITPKNAADWLRINAA